MENAGESYGAVDAEFAHATVLHGAPRVGRGFIPRHRPTLPARARNPFRPYRVRLLHPGTPAKPDDIISYICIIPQCTVQFFLYSSESVAKFYYLYTKCIHLSHHKILEMNNKTKMNSDRFEIVILMKLDIYN